VRLPLPQFLTPRRTFGVRGLLLLVLLAAIPLGLLAPAMRRYATVQHIRAYGGAVLNRGVLDREAEWSVDFINIAGKPILDDATFVRIAPTLSQLPRLELLAAPSKLTESGLAVLATLSNLQCLSLAGTSFTDAGVNALTQSNSVAILDLSAAQLSDEALASLGKMRSLRYLLLEGSTVTQKGVQAFRVARPDVEVEF
jgi:hypothetical protein